MASEHKPDAAHEDVERICRFCHSKEYPEAGGELITPCLCKGSQRYVHRYCLQRWQQHNQATGAYTKARTCDVCTADYSLTCELLKTEQPVGPQRSLTHVAFKLWQAYALCNGAVGAVRLGWVGFRTGQSYGLTPIIGIVRLVIIRTRNIRPAFVRIVIWGVIIKTSTAWSKQFARLWKDACFLSVCLAAGASAYGLATSYLRTIKWTVSGATMLTTKTSFGLLNAVARAVGRCAGVLRRAACVVVLR